MLKVLTNNYKLICAVFLALGLQSCSVLEKRDADFAKNKLGVHEFYYQKPQILLTKPTDIAESDNVAVASDATEGFESYENKFENTKDFSRFEKQSNISMLQTEVAQQLQGAKDGGSSDAVSLISGKAFSQLDSLIAPEINDIQSGIQQSLSAMLNSEGEENGFQNILSRNISSNFGSIGSNAVKDLYKSASKSLGGNNNINEQQSLENFQKNLAKLMSVGLVNSLVDSAVEQSKESSIYGLKNLELEYNYGLEEDQSVRLSLFQPLTQSKDKNDVVFTQLSFAYGTNELDSPNDDRKRATINLGLGYRYITGEIPELYNTPIMLGVNSFVDYQAPYNHLRASIGGEIKTANLGLTANRYIPIGNSKKVNADSNALFIDYQERVLGGYDVELSGYVPKTNIELFAKRSVWRQYENEEDIFADKFSAKYSPNKMFSVEVGYVKEKQGQGLDTDGLECSVGVTYTFDEPLDDQLKFNRIVNLTEKQVSDRLFEKVRRENNIRVQNACYASGDMFTLAPEVATGAGPAEVAISDLNNDGYNDIAITNRGGSGNPDGTTITVGLGNGLGIFPTVNTVNVGTGPHHVLYADFDGDTIQDLAVTNYIGNSLSILLGDGSGAFPTVNTIATSVGPTGMAVADVNKDGIQDLLVVNRGVSITPGSTVSLFLGDGAGNFVLNSTTTVGLGPHTIVLADFNKDGNIDFATTNLNFGAGNTISIRLGDGLGNFPTGSTINIGVNPVDTIVADFNKDGNADLATTITSDSKVSIKLGDGKGGFTDGKTQLVGARPVRITAGDFNRDGNTDFATTNAESSAGLGKTISIKLGDGKGGFCNKIDKTLASGVRDVEAGDLNNDGKDDLVVTGYNGGIGNRAYILLGK